MNRRNFLFGLAGLSALTATPASAQVWRKVCLADTLVADCPIYTPPVTGKGYFGGGVVGFFPATVQSSIDGIDFVTQSAINPAATLSDGARGVYATATSSIKGYFAGGFSITANIDGIVYATEAAFNPAATLADGGRHGAAGVNSFTRGYFGGGATNPSTTVVNVIDGIEFAADSAINPAAVLQDGARGWLAGVSSAANGYFCGGSFVPGSVPLSSIDGIRFNTEAAINPAASLAVARGDLAAVNSSDKGYLSGGANSYTPSYTITGEIDGISFPTETSINPSASLSVKVKHTGVNSTANGYFAGGADSVSFQIANIDRFSFSTEVVAANIASLLDGARTQLGGVQSGGTL